MDFSEIALNDKSLFDRYLRQYNPQASEMTFTNLFMWRNFYKLRFTELNGFLCIISVPEIGDPFAFMPVGNFEKNDFQATLNGLKRYFKKNGWPFRLKRITEDELEYLKKFAVCDDIVYDRDNSDYVYLAENLIKLAGKKYDGKRNHINRFKREYEFEYVPLTEDIIEECRRITHNWCKERDCEQHRKYYCEKVANFELLDNYNILGCKGAVIKVDGKFEAFTVGEMLNSDTAVIHIEKANSSIHGLYAFINQQFCEHEWSDIMYVNREQDLGVEGLRKAKLSYNPVRMIDKYTVTIA